MPETMIERGFPNCQCGLLALTGLGAMGEAPNSGLEAWHHQVMALPLPKMTPEEYLAIERNAEYKSEYFDGQMYAMAGSSANHSEVSARLIRALLNRVESLGCRVYTSDMKVRTQESGLYTYPDVSVVCGKPIILTGGGDVLSNPKVIVEVLSKSTEADDRGFKFQQYQRIATLEDYLLVSQVEPLVERFSRMPGGEWSGYAIARGMDASVVIPSLRIDIPLAEIYSTINFASSQE